VQNWGGLIAAGRDGRFVRWHPAASNPASLRQAATTKTRYLYPLESPRASAGRANTPARDEGAQQEEHAKRGQLKARWGVLPADGRRAAVLCVGQTD